MEIINKVGLCIIARIASSRLPNKVIKKIDSITIIEYIIKNLKKSKYSSDIVICTTNLKEDDVLEEIALKNNVKCVRGPELAVSDRLQLAAQKYDFKQLVRITADNIFTDEKLMDVLIENHIKYDMDYSRFNHLPNGITTEVFKTEVLDNCYKLNDKNTSEYMTLHLFNPDVYKTLVIEPKAELFGENLNLSIDNEEDFKRTKIILDQISDFDLKKIINLIKQNDLPNAHIDNSSTVKLIDKMVSFKDYKKYLNDLALKSKQIKL